MRRPLLNARSVNPGATGGAATHRAGRRRAPALIAPGPARGNATFDASDLVGCWGGAAAVSSREVVPATFVLRRPRSVQMSARYPVRAVIVALLVLLVGAGSASAATDHVVITGGAVVPAGRTAGDVVVLDGTVRIAGRAAGDVVSVSGPVRVTGRVDGDLIAVSDRAFLGPTARVGGDLRYGDERPVLAP